MADVHVRARGTGQPDQADIALDRALRVDVAGKGDVGECRALEFSCQIANARQFLDASARRVAVGNTMPMAP